MRDPLLRSSGAINGIFYEAVVVTEADRDRAFYDEINHRNVTFSKEGIRDCLFLNAQNWQTTARIVGPLRRLGVAAAAIIDLDIVSNDKSASFQTLLEAAQSLKQLVEVLGNCGVIYAQRLEKGRKS